MRAGAYSPGDYLFNNGPRSHPVEEYNPADDIRDSTSLTPAFVLDVNFPRLVQFYHPTSPICQSFQPTFLEAARLFRRDFSSLLVTFHAVSCAAHMDVCSLPEFDIHAVPTLLAYPVGSVKGHVVKRTDDNRLVLGHVADMLGVKLKHGARQNDHSIIIGDANNMDKIIQQEEVEPEYTEEDDRGQQMEQKLRGHGVREGKQQAPQKEEVGVYAAHAGKYDQIIINKKHDSFYMAQQRAFQDSATSFLLTLERNIYPPEEDEHLLKKNRNGRPGRVNKEISSLSSTGKLSPKRAEILRDFLDLCHWTLPVTWILRSLVNDLRNNFNYIIQSREHLKEILHEHPDHPQTWKWSDGCMKVSSSGGNDDKADDLGDAYDCGLWKLFHILSIGVAKQHNSVMGDRTRVSPSYASWVIRDFVDTFLIDGKFIQGRQEMKKDIILSGNGQLLWCDECRDAIVESFDECKYDLCSKLFLSINLDVRKSRKPSKPLSYFPSLFSYSSSMSFEARTNDGWRIVSLWLWQVHNKAKLVKEKMKQSSDNESSQKSLPNNQMWPNENDCNDCFIFSDDETVVLSAAVPVTSSNDTLWWHMDGIYGFLEKVYWPSGVQNPRVIVLKKTESLLKNRKFPKRRRRHGIGRISYYHSEFLILFSIITIMIIRACWMRRYKIRRRYIRWKMRRMEGNWKKKKDPRSVSPPHTGKVDDNGDKAEEDQIIDSHHSASTRPSTGQGYSSHTRQRIVKGKNNHRFVHHTFLD